jgi:AcrR family transcriptional regulator
MKAAQTQKLAVRQPRQQRAQNKVELILEAAIRLLDIGGLAALTTNAIAETAGVSIGTLYQYFANKEAILEALAEREMAAISARVLAVLQDRSVVSPQERIGRILRAVTSGYGQRPRVHRLVMEASLARGGRRLAPLVERILTLLTSGDRPPNAVPMTAAEAFVLTNAFVGVIRAMIMRPDASVPAQSEIEDAMGRLVASYIQYRPDQPADNVIAD